MTFDSSYLIYGIAVGWFTYHMFWMGMRIYQFSAFPRTYGTLADLSVRDLGDAALAESEELPAFRIVIPAYQEVAVIEATLRRAAAMNYPRTHFEICVVTYDDEPATEEGLTTFAVARRVAEEINREAGLELVHPLVVPAAYDGFFPGNLAADEQHIGKPRGLNFALRWLHETHEHSERVLYIAMMHRLDHIKRIDQSLATVAKRLNDGDTLSWLVRTLFDPNSPEYLGPLALSSQLAKVTDFAESVHALGDEHAAVRPLLTAYIEKEAPRFFLEAHRATADDDRLTLRIIPDKGFLFESMRKVENLDIAALKEQAAARLETLRRTRPLLRAALERARDPEDVYQLARKLNSRWLMVYDADADAPPDVMRHLAARILMEPDVMGFQGPVAPVLNYDEVHPLCRMGALWMSFWHGAAYPRLLHNRYWAHPLAGTNWCFRIEGFEHDGRLVRDCPYDESRRRFLLRFDPTQLTEDLEAGIRNFSEWSVNAQWHPLVEMEQVPPTAGAMFRQHARWALGTLQTMTHILHSRLPITQKTWFLMYPLRVIFASSGPFITLALILAVATDVLEVAPIFAWWTLGLAVGNLIYVMAFVRTFERYYDMRQRGAAVDYIVHHGPALLKQMSDAQGTSGIDVQARALTLQQLERGMAPGGFVSRYLASRCTDDDTPDDVEAGDGGYAAHLLRETPYRIHRDSITRFVSKLRKLLDAPTASGQENATAPADWTRFETLVRDAATSAGVNRRPRWSRHHTQILLWAIPFIYFSVTPFFSAFRRWSQGDRAGWNKTVRTPKS